MTEAVCQPEGRGAVVLWQVATWRSTLLPCAVSVRAQRQCGDPSVAMGLKWGWGTLLSSLEFSCKQ